VVAWRESPQKSLKKTLHREVEEEIILLHYKRLSSELNDPRRYRNVLDMNANLGGFAAALVNDPLWVMNVVPVEAKVNTLGIVYERGLIGTYQSW